MIYLWKGKRRLESENSELRKKLGIVVTEHLRVKRGARRRIRELLDENRRLRAEIQRSELARDDLQVLLVNASDRLKVLDLPADADALPGEIGPYVPGRMG